MRKSMTINETEDRGEDQEQEVHGEVPVAHPQVPEEVLAVPGIRHVVLQVVPPKSLSVDTSSRC
jgi:hypothetical protein